MRAKIRIQKKKERKRSFFGNPKIDAAFEKAGFRTGEAKAVAADAEIFNQTKTQQT